VRGDVPEAVTEAVVEDEGEEGGGILSLTHPHLHPTGRILVTGNGSMKIDWVGYIRLYKGLACDVIPQIPLSHQVMASKLISRAYRYAVILNRLRRNMLIPAFSRLKNGLLKHDKCSRYVPVLSFRSHTDIYGSSWQLLSNLALLPTWKLENIQHRTRTILMLRAAFIRYPLRDQLHTPPHLVTSLQCNLRQRVPLAWAHHFRPTFSSCFSKGNKLDKFRMHRKDIRHLRLTRYLRPPQMHRGPRLINS
jgi:hypothetical protein